MLLRFFFTLRDAGVPVFPPEYMELIKEVASDDPVFSNLEGFRTLSKALLVTDERWLARFDEVFDHVFAGESLELDRLLEEDLPTEEQLREALEMLGVSDVAEMDEMEYEELLREYLRRLAEQKDNHRGGNYWIGKGGRSRFGSEGEASSGIRVFGERGGGSAVKVIGDFASGALLDPDTAIGPRNIRVALSGARRWETVGDEVELDIPQTVQSTAREGSGIIQVRTRPKKTKTTKIILFMDIGGSMDKAVILCRELIASARLEFKDYQEFFFHNCIYEIVWDSQLRRRRNMKELSRVLGTYGQDYRAIIVGDANMAPYEVTHIGGCIEHWNELPGMHWIDMVTSHFPRSVWLNPVPQSEWEFSSSIRILRELMDGHMYPFTLGGFKEAMNHLRA